MIPIGRSTRPSFRQPLALLSDCHRRIEQFLGALLAVTANRQGGALGEGRALLEAALRYFREAAPRHTADEEDSLFPRLRASVDPAVQSAMRTLDALHHDHKAAERDHARVEALGQRWLDEGELEPEAARRLAAALERLRLIYQEHIGLEDGEIFPLAGRVLGSGVLEEIGREMAMRRGIDYDLPILMRPSHA